MSTRLFVGNLNRQTSADVLGHLFETIGLVKSAEIVTNGEGGTSRGFGFVTMETEELAQQALRQLNGHELEGNNIRVQLAREGTMTQSNQQPQQKFRGGYRGGYGYPRGGYYHQPFAYDYGYPPYPAYGRYRGFRGHRYFYPRPFGFGPRGRGGRGRGRGGYRRKSPDAPKSTTQIHLGGIPYTLKKEEIEEHFRDFKVKEVILSRDNFNINKNHGYAFVEFETPEEMQRALDKYPTITFQDRVCHVQPAFQHQVPPTQTQ